MAENHPVLQAQLQQLDHELEEGDITQKGSVVASSRRAKKPADTATATKNAGRCCSRSL